LCFRTTTKWATLANYGVACQLAVSERVDRLVNTRQTSVVIELSEQTVIGQLVERLIGRYPGIPRATVESAVRDAHTRFDGSPLRDYIPLLVERSAKTALDQVHAEAS
jgi:hypothetical protein